MKVSQSPYCPRGKMYVKFGSYIVVPLAEERLATIAVMVAAMVDLKVIHHSKVLKIIDALNRS
jgi:hypothetical protein